MNDIRRTILWVVFGFSMVMLWDQWQIHNGKPATFFPNAAQTAAKAKPAASASVPAASVTAAAAPSGATAGDAPAIPREKFTVTTDVLRLTFDTEGALAGAHGIPQACG